MKTAGATRKANWIGLPDPIREEEVKFELTWSADERTRQALERQAKCQGCESVTDYLIITLAQALANDEQDTIWADDGRIMNGYFGEDPETGMPKDV
jgi:hypothetical protein